MLSELSGFLADIDTAFSRRRARTDSRTFSTGVARKGSSASSDEETLGFVDLVGNRPYLSKRNLRENDRVLLFLIDYEQRRRVKVWGTAKVVPATPELVEKLKVRASAERSTTSCSSTSRGGT